MVDNKNYLMVKNLKIKTKLFTSKINTKAFFLSNTIPVSKQKFFTIKKHQ